MDPDPDPGGPKTCGSGGSGSEAATLKGTVEEERGHIMRRSCLNRTVPVNSRGHLGLNKKDFVIVVSCVVVVYPYLVLFSCFSKGQGTGEPFLL
jgi:hypothetical protein